MTLKVGMQRRVLKYHQVYSNDFSNTIVIYDLKLATDDQSDKKFLLMSKLCPLGAVCPRPGAIYMYIKEKNCIKTDFKEISLKLATNG